MASYLRVVEDDDDAVYLTRTALQQSGFSADIEAVCDGEEALHYLLAEGAYSTRKLQNPALVLLDLKLRKIYSPLCQSAVKNTQPLKNTLR